MNQNWKVFEKIAYETRGKFKKRLKQKGLPADSDPVLNA